MGILVGAGILVGVSFDQPSDFKAHWQHPLRTRQDVWDRRDLSRFGLGNSGNATSQPLYFYLVDSLVAPGSSHGAMTERAIAKSTAGATGWTLGTSTGYALMQYNAQATVWAAPVQPASAPTTNDCYRSENPYTGVFAAGTWSFSVSFEAQAVSGGTAALSIRLWRSTDKTGLTGCTEITSGAVATSSQTTASSPLSWAVTASLPATGLTSEYLFLQLAVHSIGPGAASADFQVMQNSQTASIADVITPVFSAGASLGSSGTAAITLGAATESATATVDIAASEASTLGAVTLAADGTVASSGINGALAVTLGAMTASGAGTLAIAAAESSTLGTATLSASGQVAIAGASAKTLGAATLTSTGTLAIAASEASTLGTATATSAGALAIAAAFAQALGAATASATGTLAIAASSTPTLGALTDSGSGTLAIAAAEASTLGVLASSSAGAIAIAASESSTLGALSISSDGTTQPAGNTGTFAAVLGSLSSSAAGTVDVSATESSALGSVSIAATGSLNVVATAALALGAVTLQASDATTVDNIPVIGGGGEYYEPEHPRDEVVAVASITLGGMTCAATAVSAPISAPETPFIPSFTAPIAAVLPVSHEARAAIALDSVVSVGEMASKSTPISLLSPLVGRVSRVKRASKVPRLPR